MNEGSEYDRLFYLFLFAGGTASVEEILAQVRHSTLEKCREIIALRRATLERVARRIVDAGMAMAHAFAKGAACWHLAMAAAPPTPRTWWPS